MTFRMFQFSVFQHSSQNRRFDTLQKRKHMKFLNNTKPDMLQECEALSHEKIQRSELTRTQECDRISVPSSVETRRSAWYPSKNNLSQESRTSSGTRLQAFAFLELLRAPYEVPGSGGGSGALLQ